MRFLVSLALVATLAAAPSTAASIRIDARATAPSLRVDAAGNAEVSWTAAGRRRTALVPLTGAVVHGGRLDSPDVSEAVRGSHIPFQRVLRSGSGGWYYALQTWRVAAAGPLELRFSRWTGVPTEAGLTAKEVASGVRLSGRVTLGEQPVAVSAGGRLRALLESQIDRKWTRVAAVTVRRDGTYSGIVPRARRGSSYRVIVPGPNLGPVYAPDASSVVDAPVDLDPVRRRR